MNFGKWSRNHFGSRWRVSNRGLESRTKEKLDPVRRKIRYHWLLLRRRQSLEFKGNLGMFKGRAGMPIWHVEHDFVDVEGRRASRVIVNGGVYYPYYDQAPSQTASASAARHPWQNKPLQKHKQQKAKPKTRTRKMPAYLKAIDAMLRHRMRTQRSEHGGMPGDFPSCPSKSITAQRDVCKHMCQEQLEEDSFHHLGTAAEQVAEAVFKYIFWKVRIVLMSFPCCFACLPPTMLFAYLQHTLPNLTQQAWDPYARVMLAYIFTKFSTKFFPIHLRHCRLATVMVVCVISVVWQSPHVAFLFCLLLCRCPRSWLWWPGPKNLGALNSRNMSEPMDVMEGRLWKGGEQ